MRVTITTDDGEVLDTFHVSEPEGQTDIQAANNLRQHIELGWEVWGLTTMRTCRHGSNRPSAPQAGTAPRSVPGAGPSTPVEGLAREANSDRPTRSPRASRARG